MSAKKKRKKRKIVGGFVILERKLLESAAWMFKSHNCTRLINFLILEHLKTSGKENGNLGATYNQICALLGMSRKSIYLAITEAEQLGLILVARGARRGTATKMSRFTLTFLETYDKDTDDFINPTHNWRNVTLEEVRSIQETPRKKKSPSKVEPSQFRPETATVH